MKNFSPLLDAFVKDNNVGNQSVMCIMAFDTFGDGKNGLHIKPTPLTPPSHNVSLTCFK